MVDINTGAHRLRDVNSFRERTAAYMDTLNDFIRDTGNEMMIPVVDLAKALGSPGRHDLLNPEYAIGDNAHLNFEGQKMVAKIFWDEYFGEAEDYEVVVCLGDSYTQGFPVRDDSRNGVPVDLEIDNKHQFPYWLAKKTGRTFINRGIAGNTIIGMNHRFETEVLPHFPDHCCIQGGTNDSLIGIPLEDSMENLRRIIDKCLEDEITPVMGTVIPLGFE